MDKHMQIKNKEAKRNASRGLELVSCSRARTRQLADLSEEMIMEILLRLPTRTLATLKSVCRSWRNLISTPDFTRNHLRRSCLRDSSLTPPRIFYCTHDGWYGGIESFFEPSMLDNPSEPTKVARFSRGGYRIVGSCHGLLCFFDSDADDDHIHAILWNPCTGFIFKSPQINGKPYFSGFGYDHLSDTYKFYATITKKVPSGVESSARIYTFGPTSSWRRIDDTPSSLLCPRTAYDPCMADNLKGVFLSSGKACTINWCVYDVVLYFDLGKETYGRFTLPDRDLNYGYSWTHYTSLYVLRDCLSVCYRKTQRWIVWQMKEYGDAKSWTTLAMIPFHPQLYDPLQPLYISESDVLLVMSRSFKLVLCNLNDGSIDFSLIDSCSNGMEFCLYLSQYSSYRMAYIFHETLVSPYGLQSNSSKMLLHFIESKPKPKPNLSFTW
ncbi:hypothetical protein HN51_020416 [Arachis hypogaea]|uniref:F-box domain-containing protein n=1 Tax=Arachis hypogaea TaxID=3818 RepID=A0A445C0U4_ARAHY|nr:F-box/kelch-repeat protein At3g23880-like [Arachis hypogaea]QHO32362.1 F-box/kelch-repeat protein [Arachis hypogaea]RYR44544.1 hypothetical protein Ahy_A08g040866 isoform B [Arachis hypogaea]